MTGTDPRIEQDRTSLERSADPTAGAATRGPTDRSAPWLLGAVLAGGRSRRMGRDKAAERVGDVRMIDRAVGTLRHVCPEVVVVSARGDTPSGPWTVLDGERPGVGPLAGIEAALVHAMERGAGGVFVLACDLPLLDAPTVGAVVEALDPPASSDTGGGAAAGLDEAPRAVAAARPGASPDFEPLCAVYRVSTLPTLGSLLDQGESAARRLFEEVGGVRVAAASERLVNVNTAADLERARTETERT